MLRIIKSFFYIMFVAFDCVAIYFLLELPIYKGISSSIIYYLKDLFLESDFLLIASNFGFSMPAILFYIFVIAILFHSHKVVESWFPQKK